MQGIWRMTLNERQVCEALEYWLNRDLLKNPDLHDYTRVTALTRPKGTYVYVLTLSSDNKKPEPKDGPNATTA